MPSANDKTALLTEPSEKRTLPTFQGAIFEDSEAHLDARVEWSDLDGDPVTLPWKQQLRLSIKSVAQLSKIIELSPEEREGALLAEKQGLPLAITPYYASLMDREDPNCPIRRQVVPLIAEDTTARGDLRDPLGEEAHESAPNLVQRYPDRALLLVTDQCAVYCRFCTRSRMVGGGLGPRPLSDLDQAFDYLRAHPEIKDVIVSGGDLLSMATNKIRRVLSELRLIPHIETIRLGTRVPSAMPQRIDEELLSTLAEFHPIWIMAHFNHPKELTPRAEEGLNLLANRGFPVMNQAVLLRGINDDVETLTELFRRLVRNRVRPYYLLQMDPVNGTSHLRTDLERGPELMEGLQGKLSGIAIPKLIVDLPGGWGKIPYSPSYVLRKGEGHVVFRSPRDGREVAYWDA